MRSVLIVIAAAITLSGCVDMPLPPPSSSAHENIVIHTVTIDPTVEITDKPFVQTAGSLWGMSLGGAIGEALVSNSHTDPKHFIAVLKANHIDLKQIFLSSFKARLASAGSHIKLVKQGGDVKLQFYIMFYGIHPASPFTTSLEPMLEVGATVLDKSGQHFRNVSESMKHPSDPQITYSPKALDANPQLLAAGYRKLSLTISDSLIRQLEGK